MNGPEPVKMTEAQKADERRRGLIAGLVTTVGSLVLAAWFVLGSLHAMRVGLLTRFMGVLGIVIGPGLLILPPIPFVMTFWLIGVGLLFLGRWPRGVPP